MITKKRQFTSGRLETLDLPTSLLFQPLGAQSIRFKLMIRNGVFVVDSLSDQYFFGAAVGRGDRPLQFQRNQLVQFAVNEDCGRGAL